MKHILFAFALLSTAAAHKEVFEAEDPDAMLISQREKMPTLESVSTDSSPPEISKLRLLHRFSDQKEYTQRGNLIISKDKKGRILSIKTEDQSSPISEADFKSKAESGSFYQLSIPDLGLLSSTPASYYSSMLGLDDTLTFNLDFDHTSILGFQVEYVNKPNKAKRMVNPKKKREYLTK